MHALGLQSRLACVTDRCDYPPVARAFPIVLRSREPRGAGARGRMGGRRESIGTAMYNAEKANGGRDVLTERDDRRTGAGRGVGSDHLGGRVAAPRGGPVLAQDACGRCTGGAGDGVVARALREAGLLGEGLKQSDARRTGVLALDPQRLGEVLETVQQIGAATGERDAAAALVGQLRARLRAVAARPAGAPRVRRWRACARSRWGGTGSRR